MKSTFQAKKSRYAIARDITMRSFATVLSYSISFMILAIDILMTQEGERKGDLKSYSAAAALATMEVQTSLLLAASFLFASGFLSGEFAGVLIGKQEQQARNDFDSVEHSKKQIEASFKISVLLSPILAIPPTAFMYCSGHISRYWLGQNEEVSAITQRLLRRYSPAVLPLMLRLVFDQSLFAFQQQSFSAAVCFTSFLFATLAAGLFTHYGFGLSGIAYPFLASGCVTTLFLGIGLRFHPEIKKHGIQFFSLRNLSYLKTIIKRYLGIGFNITFNNLMELAASFLITLLAGRRNKENLAAFNFPNQITFFLIILSWAFGQTTGLAVANSVGGGEYKNAVCKAKVGLATSLCVMVIPAAIFSVDPNLLTKISSSVEESPEIFSKVEILVPMDALANLLDTVRYAFIQHLRGVGDHFWPAILAALGLWIGITSGVIVEAKTDLGVYALEGGKVAGMLLGVVFLAPRWWRCFRNPQALEDSVAVHKQVPLNADNVNLNPSTPTPSATDGAASSSCRQVVANCFYSIAVSVCSLFTRCRSNRGGYQELKNPSRETSGNDSSCFC